MITQERVAAHAGVTRTMVNKVMNGAAKSRKVVASAEYLLALNRRDLSGALAIWIGSRGPRR